MEVTGSSGPPGWDLDLAPRGHQADIDYILGTVNAVLATPLTHADIDRSVRRAAAAACRTTTPALSRERAVAVPAAGLVAIAGKQVHHHRVMAADDRRCW